MLSMRQHSQNFFVEVNPPQNWPWKQNGTTVVPAVIILEVVNKWRSVLQINFLKKNQLQEMYATITILEWLLSTCLRFTEENHLKLSDLSQIKGLLATFNALQAFGFFGPQLQRQLDNELARRFMPRLSPDA